MLQTIKNCLLEIISVNSSQSFEVEMAEDE